MIRTIIVFFFTILQLNAQTYTTESNNFSLSYNTQTDDVSSSFNLRNGSDSWGIVLTNGDIPNKGVQLIGDINNNVITAYTYTNGNGTPLRSNVANEQFLGRFDGSITNNGSEYAINLSDVNNTIRQNGDSPFAIDASSGVWFKGGIGAQFTYDSHTGEIASYEAPHDIYNITDYSNAPTTVTHPHNPSSVPEPFALLTILMSLGLFTAFRRTKSTK